MRSVLRSIILCAFSITFTVQVNAAPTIYQDQQAFIDATGAVEVPAPPPSTMQILPCLYKVNTGCGNQVLLPWGSGNIKIVAPNSYDTAAFIHTLKNPISLWVAPGDPYSWGITANGPDDLHITLPDAVTAIGFHIKTNHLGKEQITFYDENDAVIATIPDSQLGTAPSSWTEFVGFTFNTPVKSIYIDNNGGSSVNENLLGLYLLGGPATPGGDENACAAQVEEAYAEGETTGYDAGYGEGESVGYNSGYASGYDAGYTGGYTSGYSAGEASMQVQIDILQTQYDQCQSDLGTAQQELEVINNLVSSLESVLLNGLPGNNNAPVSIPGATLEEQLQALSNAIGNLPPGQIDSLINDLTN